MKFGIGIYFDGRKVLKIPTNALVAKITKINEQKVHWANEAIQQQLKNLLPDHIKIRQENLMVIEQPEEQEEFVIKELFHKEYEIYKFQHFLIYFISFFQVHTALHECVCADKRHGKIADSTKTTSYSNFFTNQKCTLIFLYKPVKIDLTVS